MGLMGAMSNAAPLTCLGLMLLGCAQPWTASDKFDAAAFEQVLARTAKTRGIQPSSPIEVRLVERGDLSAVLQKSVTRDWPAVDIKNYQRALVAIGLASPEQEIDTAYVELMAASITGVYLADRRAIYIVREHSERQWEGRLITRLRNKSLLEFVMAHEIVHALQHDAYPDLIDFPPWLRNQADLAKALQAALEGDAMRYGFEAREEFSELPPPGSLVDNWRQAASDHAAHDPSRISRAPTRFLQGLAFPYLDGYRLAYREGPALLERPPLSTEQVLHADKRNETFLAIDLSAASDSLPAGCSPLHENSVGELGISQLVAELSKGALTERGHGWDGDRFLVAACGSQAEFIWSTHWDSESDAQRFEADYQRIASAVALRGGHSRKPIARRNGRRVAVASSLLANRLEQIVAQEHRARVGQLNELRTHYAAQTNQPGTHSTTQPMSGHSSGQTSHRTPRAYKSLFLGAPGPRQASGEMERRKMLHSP